MKARSILLFILLCVVTSCTDEVVKNIPGTQLPENKVRLQLRVDREDYLLPSTRNTANEKQMGDNVWVLVFQGTEPQNALFEEVEKASIEFGVLYITLTKSTAHSHVLALANIPEKYYNPESHAEELFNKQNLTSALTGKTLSQCRDILLTTLLDQPVAQTSPFAAQPIPMGGLANVPGGITEGAMIANTKENRLQLTRMVAKADVKSITGNFELMGATVINTPRQGSFFRFASDMDYPTGSLTNYLATNTDDPVCSISAAAWDNAENCYTTQHNPVYLYESATTNNTSLIIKGKYEGTETFYKLTFADNSGKNMPIHRNKRYTFEITSINGPGVATFEEACTQASVNVGYQITVADDTSHDIISNGKYYLGVSNSSLIVYGEGMQQQITAFTVNTDATAASGVTQNSITTQSSGLTITGGTNVTLTTSAAPGTTGVEITLAPGFESGEINITLGNLVKTVNITRRPPLSYSGVEQIDGNFVSALITARGEGEEWLTLSADGAEPTGNELNLSYPGPVYLKAPTNINAANGTNRTGGEFFLVEKNELGRTKYHITQACLNIGEITVEPFGYVGAFWRKNQTGERLIRIPHKNGTEGAWSALVLEGDEWIKLDTEQSADPAIGWKTNNPTATPADMNDQANDNRYALGTGTASLTGTLQPNGYIYFRIGLKSALPGNAAPARYGVILLSYNDNRRFSKIYIRQGEDADYLMRPQHTGGSGETWGSGSTPRPLAKKFSPYNLTHKEMTAGGNENHLHPSIQMFSGVFTPYPTQAGAFLQFANQANQRFAYHPVNPVGKISLWQNNFVSGYWGNDLEWSHRTCPSGWKRPADGSTTTAVAEGNNTRNSEIRQTLYLTPPEGSSRNTDNAHFGYYADGFFDRRLILLSTNGTPSTAVSTHDYHVAYAGYLFFNPTDNTSLFFPLSGQRSRNGGALLSTGTYAAYWTATAHTDPANAWVLTLDAQAPAQTYIKRSEAVSIRCVRE